MGTETSATDRQIISTDYRLADLLSYRWIMSFINRNTQQINRLSLMWFSLVHCGPQAVWRTMLPLASSENPNTANRQYNHPPTHNYKPTLHFFTLTSCLPHTLPLLLAAQVCLWERNSTSTILLNCIYGVSCAFHLRQLTSIKHACIQSRHVCFYKTLCICVRVFVFHLSGTFSRDFPYPAPAPQQATQRERRGKADMTDSLANSHLLTPVLVTLICAESKHSRKLGQAMSEPTTAY